MPSPELARFILGHFAAIVILAGVMPLAVAIAGLLVCNRYNRDGR